MDVLFASMAYDSTVSRTESQAVSAVVAGQRAVDAQRDLDDHIATLFATRTGIGAVVIDLAGHVRLIDSRDHHGKPGFTSEPGVFASIQAAIDAAADGDAIYIAAGTYREQLTIRGKHLDLLGAIADDGSCLVTLEAPDLQDLEVDASDDAGQLRAKCAVIRIKNDAHVIMRHLVIDGRHQGWVINRPSAPLQFESVSTDESDTIIEYVETRGFERTEAVRLLDASGEVKGTYTTIQEGVSAAVNGDTISIAGKTFAEDVYVTRPVTLTRGPVELGGDETQPHIVGRVLIAANAVEVTINGIAIDGELEMEPDDGMTASLILRNTVIAGK